MKDGPTACSEGMRIILKKYCNLVQMNHSSMQAGDPGYNPGSGKKKKSIK